MPLSGEGAAKHGGRANRPGVAVLCLALETETALREYRQLSPLLPPGTLVTYRVTVSRVDDFREGFDAHSWAPLRESFGEDWRALWFDRRIEPPSWVLGDEVVAERSGGILSRSSLAPTSCCIQISLVTGMRSSSTTRAESCPTTRILGRNKSAPQPGNGFDDARYGMSLDMEGTRIWIASFHRCAFGKSASVFRARRYRFDHVDQHSIRIVGDEVSLPERLVAQREQDR